MQVVGDRYLQFIGRVDYTRPSVAVLAGLAVVTYLFDGVVRVVAFAAATGLGLLPPRTGSKRDPSWAS